MRPERPPYDSHDTLVAKIAELKASTSALRLNMLMESIKDLENQIKVLSERHNKDVETIEELRALGTALADAAYDIDGDLEGVNLIAVYRCADALSALITGEQG